MYLTSLSYMVHRRVRLNVNLMSMQLLQNLSIFLSVNLRKYLNFILIKDSQLHLFAKREYVYDICFFLRNSIFTFCNQLLDVTAVDRIEFLKHGYR